MSGAYQVLKAAGEISFLILNPDYFLVVAFKILPTSLLTIPEKGSINLHASLLPQYRGAAPIQRAIMNGERETGLTTFIIRRLVDTGLILMQMKVPINDSHITHNISLALRNIRNGSM